MATKTSESGKTAIKGGERPAMTSEILNVAQAALLKLPAAALKRLVAGGSDREMYEAAWNAYDSIVGLANDATNSLYTNPEFGQLAGRSIEIMLRWQRFNTAATGAFFAALWPAIGLPMASEVEGVRAEVSALREELREVIADREAKADLASEIQNVVRSSIGTAKPMPKRTLDAYQVSLWPWSPADGMEAGEDVGN